MPIYEYECPDCGFVATQLTNDFNQDTLDIHHYRADNSMCENQRLTRRISNTTFRLYGDGFYKQHQKGD